MKKTFCFTFCFLLMNLGYCQFQSSRVNVGLTKKSRVNVSLLGYVSVLDFLPRGYVQDGSVDYTKYLQEAIDKNLKVKMPNFPIATSGIRLRDNSNLFFDSKSKLIMKENDNAYYAVISLIGCNNVNIYNANIEGFRKTNNTGNTGEWGFGVEIVNSSNVLIDNFKISSCRGDGIIISNSEDGTKKQHRRGGNNITIKNGEIDYSRRDGISIIAGKNININNVRINNTMGVAPMAGIMFEPNNSLSELDNINISNVTFINNVIGIGFNFNNYLDGGVSKSANISIRNISIKNGANGITIAGLHKENLNKRLKAITGSISISNVSYEKTQNLFKKGNFKKMFPAIRTSEFKRDGKSINVQ